MKNFFSSIRRWALDSLPRLLYGVGRWTFSSSLGPLRLLIIVQTFGCCALAISLSWNLHQTSTASDRVQAAYLVGIDDGAAMLRARIARRILELQLIDQSRRNQMEAEERQAKAEREKL